MKQTIKKLLSLTIAFSVVLLLAACGGGCGGHHDGGGRPHHKMHNSPAPTAEVIMYEAEAVEVVAPVPQPRAMMKAKMYTRSSTGGTSEMGYIKFAPAENGVNMMVDITDLRPNKDYMVKIYPCGNCDDYSCCAAQCMNLNLPVLSVDSQMRLTQTYNIPNVNCSDLKNAKIVLTRDGGYKAAWGKIKWMSRN